MCLRITDELNYELEAANQRRFAAAYAGSADFLVPAVVHQSGDVLITEWVDGKPLSQVIANGHQRERDRVGELFLRFNLTGPARCGLFYGDPHPGNYRVTADGRLAVFDFGACAEPPLGFTEMAADLLAGIVGGNPETMAANARRYGFVAPGVDLDAAALADELGLFREALVRPTFRFTTKWLRSVVLHVSQLHLSNVNRQLTLPARLTPIGRTFVAGAGVLCQIGGEVRVRDAVLTLVPEFAGEANTAPITSIRSSGID
ncbi:AarF/UbiB family protein [Antrihabitans sp. NCIMB 15448]|uniref:AarF/UbiB family protein n=1 Tax=Antrihabitans spumae TaxID=3373370 RepID=A0ABW7KQH4_9NOCA